MPDDHPGDITHFLGLLSAGKTGASEALLFLLYDELRVLAVSKMRRQGPGHTLQPTALVHELWAKIASCHKKPNWPSRGHFFSWASKTMANFLCDHARHKTSKKAGGDFARTALDDCEQIPDRNNAFELFETRDAVEALAEVDDRLATVLGLSAFCGLTNLEIASALGISESQARRSLKAARGWLSNHLGD